MLLRFDPLGVDREQLGALKRLADEIAQGPLEMPDPARRWTFPVAFEADGRPQLRNVARATGQSTAHRGQVAAEMVKELGSRIAPT
ncbi:hypothetical protein B6V73_16630 [Thioclava sp. JM3]|nr:hypothetical protein B6V73_16630 [Thioclava sp. JM3]